MNSQEVIVSFIRTIIITAIISGTSPRQDNGTLIAIPFLSYWGKDCEEFIYGIAISLQTLDHPMSSKLYLHRPNCETCSRCFYEILTPTISHYLHTQDFGNGCHKRKKSSAGRGCETLSTMCSENIFGINFQVLDNSTFAAVLTSFAPNLKHCMAVYPLPTVPPLTRSSRTYVYHIIHGRQHKTVSKGFSIQNPYDINSTISINLTDSAVGWNIGTELVTVERELVFKCREVLWVEPAFNGTVDVQSRSLSGTVISSTTPLSVFSNLAMTHTLAMIPENSSYSFDYDSQLVHQMPERAQWGKRFFIDGGHSVILPEDVRSCLTYEVTIVSYSLENIIYLKSNTLPIARELRIPPTTVIPGEHYEYKLNYTQTQITLFEYLEISSTSPILVLSDTYSNASCHDAIYYSTLIQPIEWHANKQIIVLVHPLTDTAYHYHISITVPTNKSDPAEIMESKPGEYCYGISVSSYGLIVRTHPVGSGEYTLITYRKFIFNSSKNQTRLLLHHSDPLTYIGVTVYAYSKSLHYSYSNGYALGSGSTEDENNNCNDPTLTKTTSYTLASSLSSISGIIVLIAITASVVLIIIRRRRRRIIRYSLLSEDEYPYDIFILCADQDESFVKECIEEPLKEHGYTTMRKNTAPDGLFMLGNAVVADIDHVIKICSRVIVVCSENYSSADDSSKGNGDHCSVEINCCKEKMASLNGRVIPVILDEMGVADFIEFTQHRVRTRDLLIDMKARSDFIKKLECNMNIKKR